MSARVHACLPECTRCVLESALQLCISTWTCEVRAVDGPGTIASQDWCGAPYGVHVGVSVCVLPPLLSCEPA
jgi:hypothetical protein